MPVMTKPEPKAAPSAKPSAFYVLIERAHFTEALWSLPYSALMQLAKDGRTAGVSVLEVAEGAPLQRDGERVRYSVKPVGAQFGKLVDIPMGVAAMRCGDNDKTFLHAQTW